LIIPLFDLNQNCFFSEISNQKDFLKDFKDIILHFYKRYSLIFHMTKGNKKVIKTIIFIKSKTLQIYQGKMFKRFKIIDNHII
jgi:hypothetical protein